MQILIKRGTPEEISEFFRKNRWLIARLLGAHVVATDVEPVDYSPAPDVVDDLDSIDTVEELEEEILETVEEIEDIMEEIAEGEHLSEEEQELVEEIEETIDEITELLTDDDEEPEAEAAPAVDDLTRIKGLGPKTAQGLNAAGITSFKELANLSESQIAALDEQISGFAATYKRKEFKAQADELSE